MVQVLATVAVASSPVTVTCGEKASIEQKYRVRFVSSPDQVQYKSGNPGYLDGLPVLIGKNNDAVSGAIDVYEQGFELKGGDEFGKCLAPDATAAQKAAEDIGNPVVSFANDLVYGCSVSLDLAALKTFCPDPFIN